MRQETHMGYDGHTELLKAAPKRLKDAQELLEEPTRPPTDSDAVRRHLCGACYLAGYAVECILKVQIIRLLASRRGTYVVKWSEVVDHYGATENLRGAGSHNLARLLRLSELSGELDTDREMKGNWNRCAIWSNDWRYRAYNGMSDEEARQFVRACADLHDWVRHRLL